MLSPRLRRQIFDLWTMFWSSGMTNPMTAIEQITYLLFLKQLQVLDAERSQKPEVRSIYGRRRNCKLLHHPDDAVGVNQALPPASIAAEWCLGHGTCRWEYIRQGATATDSKSGKNISPHEHLSQYVFPWLRELEMILSETGGANGMKKDTERMTDAYFQLAADKTSTLQRAIRSIDELFWHVGQRGANADLMGDIFEYLLREITASGKNGQFRTPRHIIRFMIELLNPQPGQRILDPAAGTGGFLINTTLHMRKQHTDPPGTPEDQRTVVLEWDGTPRRAFKSDDLKTYFTGNYFTAYDNDRTMVRIGWMNMVLHDIESPTFTQRDTLGKSLPDRESGNYDIVLANPPFTGTVDTDDLHKDRFPRNPRNNNKAITGSSELLFVWLILDLLRVGGRAAVIVPEGVLFGSSGAHRELRRQLLLENELEGVISLPAGVFQPYTGVKTSILVFKKAGISCTPGVQPYTSQVWFYEISADGYSLNAKREERPLPNDLWDALEKWPELTEDNSDPEKRQYFQPEFFTWRFRLVDGATARMFPTDPEVQNALDGSYERAIHELFPELDADPAVATEQVTSGAADAIRDLFLGAVGDAMPVAEHAAQRRSRNPEQAIRNAFDEKQREVNRAFSDTMGKILENGFDDHGRKALNPLIVSARAEAKEIIEQQVELLLSPLAATDAEPLHSLPNDWEREIREIVCQFAKLDGYDVRLRSHALQPMEHNPDAASEPKCWVAPVRDYVCDPEWRNVEGAIEGSHDADGSLRQAYIDFLVHKKEAFEPNGSLKSEFADLLDPECIEANDYNLSAGRYKPLTLSAASHRPPREIIARLQVLESEIQRGLADLMTMVEDNK